MTLPMANRIPRLLAGTRRTSWIFREGSNRALPGLFGQGTALRISYTRDVVPFLTGMIQRHRYLGFYCPNHARQGCSSDFCIQTIYPSCLGFGFTSSAKDRHYCHSCGLAVGTGQRGIQSVKLRIAVCERPAVRTVAKLYLRHI